MADKALQTKENHTSVDVRLLELEPDNQRYMNDFWPPRSM